MFTQTNQSSLPAFGLIFTEHRHVESGARHLHLQMPGELHAFDLSFRTLPEDEAGVAHILEHCVLEGSRRFPVPGIFHKRSSSSFSSFSNAGTGHDRTSYYFHTPLLKDFDQMLAIYLDACFFPLLREETFAQEGHRFEFAEPANPASPLSLTGVVYNEMKANYSNPVNRTIGRLFKELLPETVYALDAGGNPAAIPQLRHPDFVAFHRRHYCPANASFHYCGPLTPAELQSRLEEHVLGPLAAAPGSRAQLPSPPRPFGERRSAKLGYPYSGSEPDKAGIGMLAWRLGDARDLREELRVQTLVQWLIGSMEAPIVKLILSEGMGSPFLFPASMGPNMLLALGARSMAVDTIDARLDLLEAELQRLAEAPLDPALLKAIFDQQMLEQRRTEDLDPRGGAFPMLLLDRLRDASQLDVDPQERLNPALTLESLREELLDERHIRAELKARLLDNPHGLRLISLPDAGLGAAEAEIERRIIAQAESALTPTRRLALVEESRRLQVQQADHSRDHLIPVLHLADVDRDLTQDPVSRRVNSGLTLHIAELPTNGLTHLDMVVPLPPRSLEEAWASQLLGFLTAFGYHDLGPEQADLRRRSLGDGLGVGYEISDHGDDADRIVAWLGMSGHCLGSRAASYAEMMRLTLCVPRLDDMGRWRNFLQSRLSQWRQAATGYNVHAFVFKALAGAQAVAPWLINETAGFPGIGRLKSALEGDGVDRLVASVIEQQRRAAVVARVGVLVAEAATAIELAAAVEADWATTQGADTSPQLVASYYTEPQLWLTDSTVSYVGLSYRGLPRTHADWPLLKIALSLAEQMFMHPRIREQGGAYGAMTSVQRGSLLLCTYRDPRLAASLGDLRDVLDWILRANIPQRKVEESALAFLKVLLQAKSPVARIHDRLELERLGITTEVLRRNIALARRVTLEDLRRAVAEHVDRSTERVVIVSSRELARRDGLKGYMEQEI